MTKEKLMQLVPFYGMWYCFKNKAEWYSGSVWGGKGMFFLTALYQAAFAAAILLLIEMRQLNII